MHISNVGIPGPEGLTQKMSSRPAWTVQSQTGALGGFSPTLLFGGEGRHQASYLLRGKILHAPGHLIGTGYQIFGGQLFFGVMTGVVAIFQPRRPPGLQILPKVAFGGIFHDDIKRP